MHQNVIANAQLVTDAHGYLGGNDGSSAAVMFSSTQLAPPQQSATAPAQQQSSATAPATPPQAAVLIGFAGSNTKGQHGQQQFSGSVGSRATAASRGQGQSQRTSDTRRQAAEATASSSLSIIARRRELPLNLHQTEASQTEANRITPLWRSEHARAEGPLRVSTFPGSPRVLERRDRSARSRQLRRPAKRHHRPAIQSRHADAYAQGQRRRAKAATAPRRCA